MIEWLFFALLAVLFWTSTNLIDKILVTDHFKNPLMNTLISGSISPFFGLFILAFIKFEVPSTEFIFLSVFSGLIVFLGNYFYFHSLKEEEVSRVAPFFLSMSIFILIFSAIFLKEVLSFNQYTGIILIVSGAVILSIKKGFRITLNKSIFFALTSSFLYAIVYVISKHLLSFQDFFVLFAFQGFGIGLGALITVFFFKGFFKEAKKKMNATKWALLSETLGSIGSFSSLIAVSMAFVSLVGAIPAFQPLFVLILASIISFFNPKLLKEELKKTTLIQKFFSILIMVYGSTLLI